MSEIKVIELFPIEVTCFYCGAEGHWTKGIDLDDDGLRVPDGTGSFGHWACDACYIKHPEPKSIL